MPDVSIEVVTFTESEAAAAQALLDEMVLRGPWTENRRRTTVREITRAAGTGKWRIAHNSLLAQGNVIVATELAGIFAGRRPAERPTYVVFYGCAGVTDRANIGQAFLVREARYVSLGDVSHLSPSGKRTPGREHARLKRKWLSDEVEDADVDAVLPGSFPLVDGSGVRRNLAAETGIAPAVVIATDAVIKVAPTLPSEDGTAARYAKGTWSYGEAMGFVADQYPGEALLVEMESFGIARAAEKLGLGSSVVALRISTDVLTDHGGPDNDAKQRAALLAGRAAKAGVDAHDEDQVNLINRPLQHVQ